MENKSNGEKAASEIIDYAANLMIHENKSAKETKLTLIQNGLDEETASLIVMNLEKQIQDVKKDAANKNMIYGLLWAVGGIVATGATYSAASEGGTYVAFYGAVIYGGYRFLKGLFYKLFN
jgi:hypothetical protein